MSTGTEIPTPRLIIGLGNPGQAYVATRHNTGFAVVDRVLERLREPGCQVNRADSVLVTASFGEQRLWLAKPLTYMNASGGAVARLQSETKVQPGEILVVFDCLDLPLGRLRLRPGGGSGGHRGVASIIEALGSDAFPRLRIGIGRPPDALIVEYVLSIWSDTEKQVMDQAISAAADAVLVAIQAGVARAMNQFNRWRPEPATSPTNPKAEGVA